MKELNLRKFHRLLGIGLSVFIIIQAGSGLILTFIEEESTPAYANSGYEIEHEEEIESPVQEFFESIHAEGEGIWLIYRLAVGLGLIIMASSGSWLFIMIQKRQKGKKKQTI